MDESGHVAVHGVALEANLVLPEVEVSPETDNELVEWLNAAVKLPGKAPIFTAIIIRSLAIKLVRQLHIMLTP